MLPVITVIIIPGIQLQMKFCYTVMLIPAVYVYFFCRTNKIYVGVKHPESFNYDSCILCEKRSIINSAGRTAAMPISTIILPSSISSALIVLPRPHST
jgi:hypothetical protein